MSEWIRVEDRMPEMAGDYLVYDKSFGVAWAFFSMDRLWMSHRFMRNVTHWMPIPEPPTT